MRFTRVLNSIMLHFIIFFTNWLPDNVIFLRLRGYLASFFLSGSPENLRIGRNITFYNPEKIFVGNNVYIAQGNWFCAGETIKIEDEVLFGPNSIIVSTNHSRKNGSFRYGPSKDKKIIIKKGSWIGGNCSILAGSEIGRGTVISANSVTYNSIPDNSKYINGKIHILK